MCRGHPGVVSQLSARLRRAKHSQKKEKKRRQVNPIVLNMRGVFAVDPFVFRGRSVGCSKPAAVGAPPASRTFLKKKRKTNAVQETSRVNPRC